MRPTATHLRLVGMRQPLKLGDRFKIVLDFLNSGEIEIEVFVEEKPGSEFHISLRRSWAIRSLRTGKISSSNQGFLLSHMLLRGLGWGSARDSGQYSFQFFTVSVRLSFCRSPRCQAWAYWPMTSVSRCRAKSPEAAGANVRRIPAVAADRRTCRFPDSKSPWEEGQFSRCHKTRCGQCPSNCANGPARIIEGNAGLMHPPARRLAHNQNAGRLAI